MERQRLSFSVFLLSFTLLISKALGFIKESLMAKYFGTSGSVDAYVAARGTIESISGLLTAGVAVSLVPVFTEYIADGKEKEGWLFLTRVFRIFTAFLIVVAVLGIVFAPHLVHFLFGGFSFKTAQLTVVCVRGLFIYFIFVELGSFLQAVHQSLKHFTAMILWQIVPNAIIILFILLFSQSIGVLSVVLGFLLTGPLYFFFFFPGYLRWLSCQKDLHNRSASVKSVNDGLVKMMKMIFPLIVGQSFGYVVFFVDRYLASNLPSGSIASLNYAYRIIQIPQALLMVPLMAVFYPVLSHTENNEEFLRKISRGIRLIFYILLFLCVFFLASSLSLVRLLFERGAFLPEDTLRVSILLKCFSPMFLFWGLSQILTQGFYSRQNTNAPMKVAIIFMFVNVILSITFVRLFLLPGLALAATLSVCVHFAILLFLFYKTYGTRAFPFELNFLLKVMGVGFITFLLLHCAMLVFESPFFLGTIEKRSLSVIAMGVFSLGCYVGLSLLFGIDEFMMLWKEMILPVARKIQRYMAP